MDGNSILPEWKEIKDVINTLNIVIYIANKLFNNDKSKHIKMIKNG